MSDARPVRCSRCGLRIGANDRSAAQEHIEKEHPDLDAAHALSHFTRLDNALPRDTWSESAPPRAPQRGSENRGSSLASKTGDVALAAAVGAVKVLKWWLSGSEIGPAERVTLKDGETPREHLRQKVHEQMGGNYGPHDDLHEQAYVRDRHGNLRPYNP